MTAARIVQRARHMAELSQRQLAARAGVPQSTVARIETGRMDPRFTTVERLLRACGYELVVERRPGQGVDRTRIREMLALSPTERIERMLAEAESQERPSFP